MKNAYKKIISNVLYAVVAIGIVFAVWQIAAAIAGSEFIVPGVSDTFAAFPGVFENENFWLSVAGTMGRCAIGYLISVALFFVTYGLAVSFDGFRRVIEPVLSIMRSLPAVAITLILMIAVGGNGTPIVLGVIVIYPIMYSAAASRTATVPTELKEICKIMGASRWKTLISVWLPCLAGGLPDNLSSAFSYNVKTVIGAEILAQTAKSLGMLMHLSQVYLMPAMLVAFVISAIVLSVVLETVLRLALKIALRRFAD